MVKEGGRQIEEKKKRLEGSNGLMAVAPRTADRKLQEQVKASGGGTDTEEAKWRGGVKEVLLCRGVV